jgi:hypothetical protein
LLRPPLSSIQDHGISGCTIQAYNRQSRAFGQRISGPAIAWATPELSGHSQCKKDMKAMNILIAGATGNTGARLTHQLKEIGHYPIAMVRESSDLSKLPAGMRTSWSLRLVRVATRAPI